MASSWRKRLSEFYATIDAQYNLTEILGFFVVASVLTFGFKFLKWLGVW